MKKRNGFVSNSSSCSFTLPLLKWQRDSETMQISDMMSRGRYNRTVLKCLRKSNSHEQRKKWKETHNS
jgi:hypothetical protein